MIDERQQSRRDRDFDKADSLREQLRGMGVNVDDNALTWRGPGGMQGKVANGGGYAGGGGGPGGIARRDGDWDCPKCGKLVFAAKDTCFSCGEPKGRGGGRDRHDDRRGGGGRDRRRRDDDSRSPSRRRRRRDDSDESRSPSRRRRR